MAPEKSENKVNWKEGARMPLPRAAYSAGVINGRYIVAGGTYWEGGKKLWTARVDSFDVQANTWHGCESLPGPLGYSACITYKGTLYVFGGAQEDTVRSDALVFHDGKWGPFPEGNLPEPRMYAVATECNGLIYVLGGLSKSMDYSTASNALWVLNPEKPAKGWKVLPHLPGPGIMTEAVAVLDGKIFVLGGATAGGKNVVNLDSAYQFDPRTEHWTVLPKLSVARRCWWGVTFGDKIFLLGGYSTTYEREVFEYPPSSSALRPAGLMPHGICDAKFMRIGDLIVGAGGEAGNEFRAPWTLEGQPSS